MVIPRSRRELTRAKRFSSHFGSRDIAQRGDQVRFRRMSIVMEAISKGAAAQRGAED